MEKSSTIAELAKALVSFQLKVKTIGYDANNPFFRSRYATLTALVSETKLELANTNLVVSQLTEGEESVTTILMHTSGEYIASTLTLKPVKDDPQGRGSCITYARRYAYAAILGLVSDEDDDGNKATGLVKKEEKKPEVKPEYKTVTMKDLLIQEGIKKLGSSDKFHAWRVDNGLVENLDKATSAELTALRIAVTGLK